MARLVRVPELGIAIANVTIVEWLAREGDTVSRGQALLNVETDKIVMEVPCEASGILLKILTPEESELAIDAPIAIIGQAGEDIASLVAEAETELAAALHEAAREAAVVATEAVAQPMPAPPSPTRSPAGKVLASPLAKRLAREKGIDLALVPPTGKGGKISKEDVLNYAGQKTEVPKLPLAAVAAVDEATDDIEIIPFKGTRKAIAENMVKSVQTAAHYSMGAEVACDQLVNLRNWLKEEFRTAHGVELTFVPFMVKAIAAAVNDHPIVNSTIRGDNLVVQKTAHVGVAVAKGDFIFVPVIREPSAKSVLQITQELAEYIQLVRDDKLTPSQTHGGTITLTNMGVAKLSTNAGLSIIRQPEVASIAMGRIRDRVVPLDGAIVIRPIMNITFSYDHRVVMGVPGARFAERLVHYLENPEIMLAC
jgi:pyruvate/2-oxoglutarate dehydrogenase complex dihydrolipoamide acyltransferase (E2) component